MKKYKDLIPHDKNEEDNHNLGLDADHSSDGDTPTAKWNDDNDRISGNPGGENDADAPDKTPIHSPLEDK